MYSIVAIEYIFFPFTSYLDIFKRNFTRALISDSACYAVNRCKTDFFVLRIWKKVAGERYIGSPPNNLKNLVANNFSVNYEDIVYARV